jgi:hypothetical protein
MEELDVTCHVGDPARSEKSKPADKSTIVETRRCC